MKKEKPTPRFKLGDAVRVSFVAEVVDSWVDPVGTVMYVVHPAVGSVPEECLEPWEEEPCPTSSPPCR